MLLLKIGLISLVFGLCAAGAEDTVGVTELSPNVLVLATGTGNVVASVGPDGALLIGTPSAASTAQISDILSKRTQSAIRYVVIAPQDVTRSEGDAGWGKRGAFVAMQEKALERLGGHAMGPAQPLPPHIMQLGVDRPRIAFSEVITFDMNGEAIHVVHQPPAYSDADSIVHFHAAHLVYLGNVFPGDGYPEVDLAQGGKFDGVLSMLQGWTGSNMRVLPARGKVATGPEVKTFCGMIATVRDRVKTMVNEGKSEEQVMAAHPTAEFDDRWGHGHVTADAFVHEIYLSLKTK